MQVLVEDRWAWWACESSFLLRPQGAMGIWVEVPTESRVGQ